MRSGGTCGILYARCYTYATSVHVSASVDVVATGLFPKIECRRNTAELLQPRNTVMQRVAVESHSFFALQSGGGLLLVVEAAHAGIGGIGAKGMTYDLVGVVSKPMSPQNNNNNGFSWCMCRVWCVCVWLSWCIVLSQCVCVVCFVCACCARQTT